MDWCSVQGLLLCLECQQDRVAGGKHVCPQDYPPEASSLNSGLAFPCQNPSHTIPHKQLQLSTLYLSRLCKHGLTSHGLLLCRPRPTALPDLCSTRVAVRRR